MQNNRGFSPSDIEWFELVHHFCYVFLQCLISPSERRSEAGGLLYLPSRLFLSPLSHCEPQSVWSWQLFGKASSLTPQSAVTGHQREPVEISAGALVLSSWCASRLVLFLDEHFPPTVIVLPHSPCTYICKCLRSGFSRMFSGFIFCSHY